jgi:hypothetical protein
VVINIAFPSTQVSTPTSSERLAYRRFSNAAAPAMLSTRPTLLAGAINITAKGGTAALQPLTSITSDSETGNIIKCEV